MKGRILILLPLRFHAKNFFFSNELPSISYLSTAHTPVIKHPSGEFKRGNFIQFHKVGMIASLVVFAIFG